MSIKYNCTIKLVDTYNINYKGSNNTYDVYILIKGSLCSMYILGIYI